MRFARMSSVLGGALALWCAPAIAAPDVSEAPAPPPVQAPAAATPEAPAIGTPEPPAAPAPTVTAKPARVQWLSPRPNAVLFRPGAVRLKWSSTFPAGTYYSVTMARDGRTFQTVVAGFQAETAAEWTLPEQERFDYFLRVKAMNADGEMLDEHIIPVHVVPEDAVIISKENQMLWAFEGGRLQQRTAISTGSRKTETREGWFAVYNRVPNHHSSLYDAPMPFSLFFSGGMALHASTYVDELGTPTSHGCVRLRYTDAQALYAASEVGRPVIVTAWGEDMSYLDAADTNSGDSVRTARSVPSL